MISAHDTTKRFVDIYARKLDNAARRSTLIMLGPMGLVMVNSPPWRIGDTGRIQKLTRNVS
jgi:hypothetical protein